MKIREALYQVSAVNKEQYPTDGLPEIALVGRSNVGKSSLINKLLNRKKLAHTSSSPGKTRTLNFYKINNEFFFVDLPGYGYAKVSKAQRQEWGKMIESYLLERQELKGVIQLIDLRHPPTADDIAMWEWLQHYQFPTIIAATKADKISRNKLQKHANIIRKDMNITEDTPIVLFSAETGNGVEEMHKLITKLVP